MRLVPLGVNGAFTVNGFQTNFILEAGENKYLIDAGITLPQSLRAAGYKHTDISGVFITHFHSDHINGLQDFAQQCLYKNGGHRPTIYMHFIQRRDFGLYFNPINKKPEDYFDIEELPVGDKPYLHLPGGLTAEFVETTGLHEPDLPHSFGYSFTHAGARLVLTGDIKNLPRKHRLRDLIEDPLTTVVVHDCVAEPNPVHMHLDGLLASYSPDAHRRMHIVHFEDNFPAVAFERASAAGIKLAQAGVPIEVVTPSFDIS